MLALVTTFLDALGLLLVAAGAAAGAWLLVGPAALAVAGVVVLTGSWLAVRQAAPKVEGGADTDVVEKPAAVWPPRSRRQA